MGVRSRGNRTFIFLAVILASASFVAYVASSSTVSQAAAKAISLPPAKLPTAKAIVDARPSSCPSLNGDPNTGSGTATQTGSFPWPPAPDGVSENKWVEDSAHSQAAIPRAARKLGQRRRERKADECAIECD